MKIFLLNIYLLSLFWGSDTSISSDNKNLKEYSSRFFSQNSIEIKERPASKDLAESGQGEAIFIIKNNKKNPIGIIKTLSIDLPDERLRFKSEAFALDTLNHLPFKKFHTVSLKGIAEITVNDKQIGLIAEEFAPGYSINQLLKTLSQSSSQKKRSYLLQSLKDAMKTIALALAELHQHKTYSYPDQSYITKFSSDDLPGSFGMIHGDTHPGNIFYDPTSKKAFFIDLGSAHLERNGAPILQDVANFLLTFEIFASYYHLSDAEIEELTNTFLSSYRLKIPNATDASIAFYKEYYIQLFANNELSEKPSEQELFVRKYCETLIS